MLDDTVVIVSPCRSANSSASGPCRRNASSSSGRAVQTTSEADFDRVYSVNVKGVFLCAQAGIDIMLRQGGGVILNMASVLGGEKAAPNRLAYTASKAGVVNLAQGLAEEWAEARIRVNVVSPERADTPMRHRAFPGESREVFHLVWFLGADQKTIADLLDCSERTVKTRWREAREAVKAALGGRSPEET